MFEVKRIHKTYWAVVSPIPVPKQGSIDAPLAKITDERHRWHMQVDPSGQSALTHYKVLGEHDGMAWVEMKPKTGRTHQLRVHMAHLGSPIIGDIFYGDKHDERELMLHARSLTIPWEQGAPPIIVEAPLPEHMRGFMPQLKNV
jgi:23S rRNA-/tRNA-specific pseudouridylate synthase